MVLGHFGRAKYGHFSRVPKVDDNIAEIRRVVRRFHELGGSLVFGTDTGYLTDYDVAEEFGQLTKASFIWVDILRMLTENPARLFKEQNSRGRIAPGMIAALTLLEADPATDPSALSRIRYTIRNGACCLRIPLTP